MKTLLIMDENNYKNTTKVFEKYAVRGVVRRNGKIAVQQAGHGEYKLLGGGVEGEESYESTLFREVREEGGLIVKPESVELVGEIVEMRRDIFDPEVKYVCHTIFFYCDVEEETVPLEMTASEIAQGFQFVWVSPEQFIRVNKTMMGMPWTQRDAAFVEMMMKKQV